MFGLFRRRRSPVCHAVEALMWVHRAWFEWSIEDDRRLCVLVVEMAIELDPGDPDFEMARLDEVVDMVASHAGGGHRPDRIRVTPRKYGT